MSGMVPLRAITKLCCAARLFFRERRIEAGKEPPSEHFGCATCGNAYVHDQLGWHRVSAVEELRAMVAEDTRGTLTEARAVEGKPGVYRGKASSSIFVTPKRRTE